MPPPHQWEPSRILAEAVQQAPVRVVGILCRRKLSLQTLRTLGPGSLIPLPQNVLDDARLETVQGQVLARGRLGEADGFHAIRLRSAGETVHGGAAPSEAELRNAATRPLGPPLSPHPLQTQFEPPLADIDTIDAFRDKTSSEMGRVGGQSAG